MIDSRWSGWKEELDQWENELTKDERLLIYRMGPWSLFAETKNKSNSWLLVRTKEGKTIALDENMKEWTSPKEFLENIQ